MGNWCCCLHVLLRDTSCSGLCTDTPVCSHPCVECRRGRRLLITCILAPFPSLPVHTTPDAFTAEPCYPTPFNADGWLPGRLCGLRGLWMWLGSTVCVYACCVCHSLVPTRPLLLPFCIHVSQPILPPAWLEWQVCNSGLPSLRSVSIIIMLPGQPGATECCRGAHSLTHLLLHINL